MIHPRRPNSLISFCLGLLLAQAAFAQQSQIHLSGIYPHLAMFNDGGECGTGAVVPWADRLWVITYSPHSPRGSSDRLYEITPELRQIVRPESIGGTPANRMIHPESRQLFIGPYAIAADRQVRIIPYATMPGRHTGIARHLETPAKTIVYATMEEGFYEVDVQDLKVRELFPDGNALGPGNLHNPLLPGYHGKGFYSGQGVYVYANNGEFSPEAKKRPDIPSGVLVEGDGKQWKVIRRNQFTDVTGPGGIRGNANPATDPIWSVGWDAKSLLLAVRSADPDPATGSRWSFYRLPKGSHSYDGAHGWNTEWPRIRDIGEEDFLMTMHGTFWRFPKSFTRDSSAGIAPRSNYLKVIGDFCRWNDRIVLGCDDTAKLEFLNKRKAKGKIHPPQSQSNLWFVEPQRLDQLGPALGRGAVWINEPVKSGVPSDPFLFSGYDLRGLSLAHRSPEPVTFHLEVDRQGNGVWTHLREVVASGTDGDQAPRPTLTFVPFAREEAGAWIRLVPTADLASVTAVFSYRNYDSRTASDSVLFDGLARPGQELTGGLVRARGGGKRTLSFAAVGPDGADLGYYELGGDLELRRVNDPALLDWTKENTAIPAGVLQVEESSVLFIDDQGNRWRLPKGAQTLDHHPFGDYRVDREVATERDLFNAHGTFYELPAENAGGFAKVRPVTTHNLLVHDYCSYRGLLVISGVATNAPDSHHILRSDDRKTALWAGAVDDLWQLGKPSGMGGPWKNSQVQAGVPSDPYLMTAYDRKQLTLSASRKARISIDVDLTGDGHWAVYRIFEVGPTAHVEHEFPREFSAYWIRFRSDVACTASAQLRYH